MKDQMRQFHITDFPQKNILVQLNLKFAGIFFSKLLNAIPLTDIAKRVGVKADLVARYIVGYREGVEEPAFIRLNVLLRLVDLFIKIEGGSAVLPDLEENIRCIRGYGRSGVLLSPKLPVYEDKHLVRLIVHMIGDGTITEEYGTTKTPHYTNGNAFLRRQFLQTMMRVFGDVSDCTRSCIDKSGRSRSYIAFSKWIGYVLQHWYPDARFDEIHGSLPPSFLKLPLSLKVEMVRTFGDDDGHVGAHSIRFTSGGPTILRQIRELIVELMEATLPTGEFEGLVGSVGEVKACQTWFILDVFRPLYGWYAEQVGFTHPERAARLRFQLECDRVWAERGLDGFDLDFLALVGLREVGSVGDVARRFMLREDFLFKVFQRLRRLGWIERVAKRKFTTYYRTSSVGEELLQQTLARRWSENGRVVVRNEWWQQLRGMLLGRFGTAAAVARAVGMPETTVRGYLQGRRQWMHVQWVVALATLVGWDAEQVAEGVVVGFPRGLAPRYEQCEFLAKDLGVYRRFCSGEISFDDWLVHRRVTVEREVRLLDAGFAEKLQSAGAIRARILELAKAGGGEITLEGLKADPLLRELVADRYGAYVADRMAKLIKQGVFRRVRKGCYQLVVVRGS